MHPFLPLADDGLNLQAIFNLSDLPADVVENLAAQSQDITRFSQLLLVAHGGRRLWQKVEHNKPRSNNPIDDFSVQKVCNVLERAPLCRGYEVLYPGDSSIDLRRLGQLAGWHHPSLFRVGINQAWGTWYAYRAAVLTDSDFAPTPPVSGRNPCDGCQSRPCIEACPAHAVGEDGFDAEACYAWRVTEGSPCADRCLARLACPVGKEHIYTKEQNAYHCGRSLKVIRALSR